jgi:hypothetical protein
MKPLSNFLLSSFFTLLNIIEEKEKHIDFSRKRMEKNNFHSVIDDEVNVKVDKRKLNKQHKRCIKKTFLRFSFPISTSTQKHESQRKCFLCNHFNEFNFILDAVHRDLCMGESKNY